MHDSNQAPEILVHGYPHLVTIKAAIKLLHAKLPRAELLRMQDDVPFHVLNQQRSEDPLSYARNVAKRLAEHFDIPAKNITVRFNSELANPGNVTLSGRGYYPIQLNSEYCLVPGCIPAILSHEMCHVYLFRKGLKFTGLDNEILTDTACAYLGAGWLSLAAYEKEETRSEMWISNRTREVTISTHERSLGYISPEEFGYILAKRETAFSNGQRTQMPMGPHAASVLLAGTLMAQSESRTPPLLEGTINQRLRYAVRRWHHAIRKAVRSEDFEGYQFEWDGTLKVVFPCPTCYQKLRVPTHCGPISVRCHICSYQFGCNP